MFLFDLQKKGQQHCYLRPPFINEYPTQKIEHLQQGRGENAQLIRLYRSKDKHCDYHDHIF